MLTHTRISSVIALLSAALVFVACDEPASSPTLDGSTTQLDATPAAPQAQPDGIEAIDDVAREPMREVEPLPGDAGDADEALPEVEIPVAEGDPVTMTSELSNPGGAYSSYCADEDETCWNWPFIYCGCEFTNYWWQFCSDDDGDGWTDTCVNTRQYAERTICGTDSWFGCIDYEVVIDYGYNSYGWTPEFYSRWFSSRWGATQYGANGQDCADHNNYPNGQWWSHGYYRNPNRPEWCNSYDHDCNGQAYNGMVTPGTGCGSTVSLGGSTCYQNGTYQCLSPTATSSSCVLNTTSSRTLYRDSDGDGYGDPFNSASWSYTCIPSGWVFNNLDCNDASSTDRPGGTEVCDGEDNDCDTVVDEGNPGGGVGCTVGGQQGECASGSTQCISGSLSCVGPSPAAETCANMGADNNCDGITDNVNGLGDVCAWSDGDLCADAFYECVGTGLTCVPRGPVVAYDFNADEGSTTTDVSANGLTGSLEASPSGGAAPVWVNQVDGRDGVIDFNNGHNGGSNSSGGEVEVNVPGFSNKEGSVEMWVRPDFNGADGSIRGFFQSGTGWNSANWVTAFKWSSVFYFRIGANGTCCSNDLTFNDNALIQAGQWSHWVFTWSQSENRMSVYVNGFRVATRTSVNWSGPTPSSAIRFGRGHESSFRGEMDDVAVYRYALSQAEVSERYSLGAFTPGLGSGNDPGGQNLELCDFDPVSGNPINNDCNGATANGVNDPRLGGTCDGPDSDQCENGAWACGATEIECVESVENILDVCDGLDNDCSGLADDDPTQWPTWYRDADGDGYGNPLVTASSCAQPAGYIATAGDCNDGVAAINPGATESCNGVDDNCVNGIDDAPGGGWGGCSLSYPAASCNAGVNECVDGALVCAPDFPEYRDEDTVTVLAGLLGRNTGAVDAEWKLMTADARYAYSLSYTYNGIPYAGWTYRVYDPRNGWAMVGPEISVPATSYYTDGLISDGTYLYPLQWTGGPTQQAHRIRISDGQVQDLGYTFPAQFISGQFDPNSERVFLGTLRFGARVRWYDASGGWNPPARLEGDLTVPEAGDGIGVVATDGTYLYGQRWYTGTYPGPSGIIRYEMDLDPPSPSMTFGGYASTGAVTNTLTAFYFDGHYYTTGMAPNTLNRVRVSPASPEVCDGADNDCDGIADEDGAGGCTVYLRDVDGDGYGVQGDAECLCAPNGVYRAVDNGQYDCDDAVFEINPGVAETIGDGTDQTCDGLELCYVDQDQDLYRSADGATSLSADLTCPLSLGLASASRPGGDCNDTNVAIHPNAPEPCDGLDNDCDGVVDQFFPTVGQACNYLGDAADCTNGHVTCNAAGNGVTCSAGPIAAYDFDDASGTIAYDTTPNGRDLTLVNGATFSTVAREGTSLSLDGSNDYAMHPTPAAWVNTGGMTISMWVRPNSVAGARTLAASQNTSGAATWSWRVLLYDGVPTVEFYDGAVQSVASNTALPAYSWVHIAATAFPGGDLTLYVNGAVAGSTPLAGIANVGQPTLGATVLNGVISDAYAGIIDEVVLLPTALPASRILDLTLAGSVPADYQTLELCDGYDNDCNGTVDDHPLLANLGDDCDGGDADSCTDAVVSCGNARQGVECRMSGPLAFYTFDEASGTTTYNVAGASFGQSGHGTMQGAINRVAGYRGTAVDPNYTGYVSIPHSPLTDINTNELTMAAWVYPESYGSGDRIILNKENSYEIAVNSGGTFRCAINTNTRGWFWTGSQSVPLNTWSHVACTLGTDGYIRTYVNGSLASTSPFVGGAVVTSYGAPSPDDLFIGRRRSGAYIDARLDEVGVWHRALSVGEISNIMTNGADAAFGTAGDPGVNFERCDGADNNCSGTADDGFFYVDPQGGVAAIDDVCDGADTDFCADEGGIVQCSADQFSVICTDDPLENDVEICDGLDNDCDGTPDDGLTFVTYFPDTDGDNFGDGARGESLCAAPTTGTWVLNGADCSDVNDAVYPGAAEQCDGFDNDCDSVADDGPLSGEGDPCTAAAPGICANGTQECSSGLLSATVTDGTHGAGFLNDWLVVGPWPWTPQTGVCETDMPPNEMDPSLAPVAGDTFDPSNVLDPPYPWFEHRGLYASQGTCNSGFGVDLDAFDTEHPPFPSSLTFTYVYAATYIHSPGTRLADLALGIDDGARIWLNGSLVFEGAECGCHTTDSVLIEDVTLNEGQNILLMQVKNNTAEAGWVARFLDPNDGLPLTDLFTSLEPSGDLQCRPGDPAPAELCNGFDDDCDGALATVEQDLDGDGQWECLGDCNPIDPDVYLGAPELCDYRDNDCDGFIDDGLAIGTYCDDDLAPFAGMDPLDDVDMCADGKVTCDLATGAAVCSRGAGAILRFDIPTSPGANSATVGADAVVVDATVTQSAARNGAGGLSFATATGAARIPASAATGHEFSFAAWVNPVAPGPRAIVSRLDSGGSNALLVGTSNWLDFLGVTYDNFVPPLPLGTWTHVAVVYNARTLTLYHDGIVVSGPHAVPEVVPGIPGGAVPAWQTDVWVGQELDPTGSTQPGCSVACSTNPGEAFVGAMDDVAWYRHALTQTEIANLMLAVDPQDLNREFCDFRDNDCDGTLDNGHTLGVACDGDDFDNCEDAVTTCDASGLGTECAFGGAAVYDASFTTTNLGADYALDLAGEGSDGLMGPTATVVDHLGESAIQLDATPFAYLVAPLDDAMRAPFTAYTRVSAASTTINARTVLHRMTQYEQASGCTGEGFSVLDNGRLYFQCVDLRVDGLSAALHASGTPWVDLVVVYDGATLRAWLNGSPATISEEIAPNNWMSHGTSFNAGLLPQVFWTSDLLVGQRQTVPEGGYVPTRSWGGRIADLAWFDLALTSPDLDTLVAGQVPSGSVNFELCDGLNNDCIDVADDPYRAPSPDPLDGACVTGLGECAETGVFICDTSQLDTTCSAAGLPPNPELCDGLDNDCDGVVDQHTQPCSTACESGIETCIAGSWENCTAREPEPEICDLIDNDCNGPIDDGIGTYTCGLGECARELDACISGAPEFCDPFLGATPEICDPLDHDCDGDPYNGYPVGGGCTVGTGACEATGSLICNGAGDGTECDAVAGVPEPFDICGNGIDDNCNGAIDEDDVVATLEVLEVAVGDPDFDYAGRCDVFGGNAPQCVAVVFRVDNTGTNDIPVDTLVEIYSDVGGSQSLIGSGGELPRAVPAGGGSDTFVYCFENLATEDDAAVVVRLNDTCVDVSATSPDTYDLRECNANDLCDGIDNNVNGEVDELPEACGGDARMECLYDPLVDEYVCSIPLSDGAGACVDGSCPTGSFCADGYCVDGCEVDEQCGPNGECDAGSCVSSSWSADASARAFDAGADAAEPAQAGCAASGSRNGTPVALLLGFMVLVGTRRRRR